MKEVCLTAERNIKIALNHYAKAGRNCVLIICPGCFMSKDAKPFLDMAEAFFKHLDVITMDFRGHGKSGGLFTFSAKEHLDLKSVIDYAKTKYTHIVLLGFSLGAATAIIYTAKHKDINGVIAVSAPTDFEKIENHFLKKEAVIPAMEKFEFGKSPTLRPGNILLKKIKPAEVASKISPIPILFLSGEKDPIIHQWHAEELFENAREPKSIKTFPGGLHAEELYLKSKEAFLDICLEWCDDLLKTGSR